MSFSSQLISSNCYLLAVKKIVLQVKEDKEWKARDPHYQLALICDQNLSRQLIHRTQAPNLIIIFLQILWLIKRGLTS